jgi:hypothetical protein
LAFGVIGAVYVWLLVLWLLKKHADARKAYVERHSGDDEDEAVKENVKRIKKELDIEFHQLEQGLLLRSWRLAQEEGYLMAITVFVFSFIWWLLYKEIYRFLLRRFIRLRLICYELTYATWMRISSSHWQFNGGGRLEDDAKGPMAISR